jgi:hypothetical protein
LIFGGFFLLSEHSERSGKEFGIKPRSCNELSWSQVLGDKILQELPEELAASTSFKVDEKERLCMFFGFKLAGPDFQVVLDVVKRYQGDFVNQKEDGKDVGFFMFPKPQPKPASVEVPKPADQVPPAVPKQPSPITIFARDFCSVCEDSQQCDVSTPEGKFHRAMCLQLLDLQQVTALNVNLGKLCRVIGSQPVQDASSNHVDARSPPAAQPVQKVERNTRPTEGHREGDVVWIYAENRSGERYEQALEKDNERSNDYFAIRRSIIDAEQAGKKGIVLQGKWCWLSQERDYIGRKPAKTFAKGGGRRF